MGSTTLRRNVLPTSLELVLPMPLEFIVTNVLDCFNILGE
jgi:hypothetical protein